MLSFHPAPRGGKAPTILEGHGWGGSRETDPEAKSDETTGNVGVGALRKAGFNVLTWDCARVRELAAAPSPSTRPTPRAATSPR